MKNTLLVVPIVAGAAGLICIAVQTRPALARTQSPEELLAQGRHLVTNVALCGDCHSPRLGTGGFDRARWLGGAPIGFNPVVPMPWAPVAPPLAGLPGRSDAEVVALLTTGARRDGTAPLPPMPAFHLSEQEAAAVVAYLRSLGPTP
ncbi:MAG: c-type cytochrome [Opitutaceae bacterium]|nr:c-type cytochrome [Opitutaceae bacterium]